MTWQENTVSTQFWSVLLLLSIDRRHDHRRHRHLLNHELYESPGRTFFKGKLFTASLNWAECQHQLEELERTETHTSLQVNRVRITIAAELIDVNRLLKDATVRRHIVIELIHMHRNMGHPDCRGQQKTCICDFYGSRNDHKWTTTFLKP